jgi:hypothetical protein
VTTADRLRLLGVEVVGAGGLRFDSALPPATTALGTRQQAARAIEDWLDAAT